MREKEGTRVDGEARNIKKKRKRKKKNKRRKKKNNVKSSIIERYRDIKSAYRNRKGTSHRQEHNPCNR